MLLLLYVEMILDKYGYKIHLQTQHFIRQKNGKDFWKNPGQKYNCTPPSPTDFQETDYFKVCF